MIESMSSTTLVQTLAGPFGRRLFSGLMRDRASIFMLHRLDDRERGIYGHSAKFVRSALSALRASGAQFVPLRAMIDRWANGRTADPNWIAFTIDDGFADQAQLIRKAFLPMKCPVTVFLITGFLDGKLWPWDDQLAYAFGATRLAQVSLQLAGRQFELDLSSATHKGAAVEQLREVCKAMPNAQLYDQISAIASALAVQLPAEPPAAFKPMSWDEVRELEQAGVDFAPHSITHRIFSRLSPEQVRIEISTSWSRLRTELRNPAPIFAWPTGRHTDFDSKDIEIAKQEGLIASVATDDDYAHIGAHDPFGLYRIKRFSLPYDIPTVLRYGSWLERARQFLPL
jgi:peptidoglycan/xylan/chitin deacetylase (PgdA/CDA1 family)